VTSILPSRALLLDRPIERRHAPTIDAGSYRGYETFRPCLRWDFFFTCPFCLLHEAQVSPDGAAGSSQFWIEHLVPQSQRSDLRNSYENLVYTCRRCNQARRSMARSDATGRRLLDPCADVWSAHFIEGDDELEPATGDGAYTARAYDINSPQKVTLRRMRRETVEESLHVLASVPALLDAVMATINLQPRPEQCLRLEIAEHLHKSIAAARRALLQLTAIPRDADDACACEAGICEIPRAVGATLLHLHLPAGRQ
jgi:hypothetical protein